MEMRRCALCDKNETALRCGICQGSVCKYCARLLDQDAFSFLEKVPEGLSHSVFCPTCFDARVSEPLAVYNDVMERAKDVDVFFKKQHKETRLVKRTEKPVSIEECFDRDDLILRLAFFAAQANFNAIVDVELISEKVGVGSYKKLKWRGSGVPANISARTRVHDKSIWHNPN